MSGDYLASLATRRRGITSVCSAHPQVIEAALRHAQDHNEPALIEATCNQVNQEGGYTGMTPSAFRNYVYALADRLGLPRHKIILGGDHLGPSPWRHLPVEEALRRAEGMIAAYASAGFEKLHLDTSMGCGGDPIRLADETVAARAARLARVAETEAARLGLAPRYVIGTEVPTPGGAPEEIEQLTITSPAGAQASWHAHRSAFLRMGLEAALNRVIALVVQPGVEFGNVNVIPYQPAKAAALSAVLEEMPGLVFEAHSTDYQPRQYLSALVADGFMILKVGPALTFALREILYGLDGIAGFLDPSWRNHSLMTAMEEIMLAEPDQWRSHYTGTKDLVRIQRHFSYSDRIRYYWSHPRARSAVDALLARLRDLTIPEPLLSQYIPRLHQAELHGTAVTARAEELVLAGIRQVLQVYSEACAATAIPPPFPTQLSSCLYNPAHLP
jgi:D-tagatose-1,6-bisphosphate aldolase subunit GatZ/KbaZ